VIANPRGLTITLANADTSYNLLTLIQAVDAEITGVFSKCRRITLQAELDAADARFYVGNSDLTGINRAVELFATQSVLYESEDVSASIDLNRMFVRSDKAAKTMNVALQWW
jgi:hypothetical protein